MTEQPHDRDALIADLLGLRADDPRRRAALARDPGLAAEMAELEAVETELRSRLDAAAEDGVRADLGAEGAERLEAVGLAALEQA
ncbi:MAG: hypothetical protein AAFZ65_15625, partial [Planctomycetota bacterium]